MHDNKILVWLPSPMGDAILCTPALRAIREKFKSSEITFLANKMVRNILSPCSFNDNWLEYEESPLAIIFLFISIGLFYLIAFILIKRISLSKDSYYNKDFIEKEIRIE